MITTITESINPHLKEMGEDVMGFLNEIQLKYPDAITFACYNLCIRKTR
jgi:hypothetical protein